MPAQRESGRIEPRLPAVLGADGGGVVEEAVFFFLLGQLGEFGVEWVIGCEERLFAMQDRRVGGGLVFEAIDLAGSRTRELLKDSATRRMSSMAKLMDCSLFTDHGAPMHNATAEAISSSSPSVTTPSFAMERDSETDFT